MAKKKNSIEGINSTKVCYRTIIIISIIFGSIIIACFATFFNYSIKLSKDRVELTKLTQRTEELEKKNGKEQKQIDDLKEEIKRLEEIIRKRGGN